MVEVAEVTEERPLDGDAVEPQVLVSRWGVLIVGSRESRPTELLPY